MLSQEGDGDGFASIADSVITNTNITSPECNRTTSPNICFVNVSLLGRYFIGENSPDILATGAVELILLGVSGNHRLCSVCSPLNDILDTIEKVQL